VMGAGDGFHLAAIGSFVGFIILGTGSSPDCANQRELSPT